MNYSCVEHKKAKLKFGNTWKDIEISLEKNNKKDINKNL